MQILLCLVREYLPGIMKSLSDFPDKDAHFSCIPLSTPYIQKNTLLSKASGVDKREYTNSSLPL